MASQSSTSSGPFTSTVSNLPFGSPGSSASVFKGSPAHVSALSGPATRAGIRPVIPDGRLEERPSSPRVPVAFRPPAFASWASCSRRGIPPLSRSAYRAPSSPDPTGFPRSAHARSRPGWVPSLPRGQRCSHDRSGPSGRRLPPLPAARPYHPGPHPIVPELAITRHHQGFTRVHPSGLPLACCSPGWNRGPWASSPGFAPPQAGPASARRGGDRSRALAGATHPASPDLQSASSLAMCDLVSHQPHRNGIADPRGVADAERHQSADSNHGVVGSMIINARPSRTPKNCCPRFCWKFCRSASAGSLRAGSSRP